MVGKQAATGIDIVDDGEYGKPSFMTCVNQRLGGFDHMVCVGPVKYVGTELLQRDLENFKLALEDVQVSEAMRLGTERVWGGLEHIV